MYCYEYSNIVYFYGSFNKLFCLLNSILRQQSQLMILSIMRIKVVLYINSPYNNRKAQAETEGS